MSAKGRLPKIAVLATGGTIAGVSASSTNLTGYTAGVLPPEQIMAAVPGLSGMAHLYAEQLASIDSSNMTIALWLQLAERVNGLLSGDTAGVVITHGTDTMEETAYFLNLVVKSRKPVILVGAMRPASAISADGPLNLLQAITVASSVEARGRGVLLVMNGEINEARDVAKTNTTQVGTFHSANFGPLGAVVGNKAVFYREPTRKHTRDTEFDVRGLNALPKVEIIYSYVDAGLDALCGILAAKPDGIVVAGVGNGTLPLVLADKLATASASGIAVVRSSRVGSGPVTPEPDHDAVPGFVAADTLSPQKARILLMLALTKTRENGEIARMFQSY